MQNMPNISTTEVVVVCTAVLLFSVVPALLQWNDQRRRRKLSAALARAAVGLGAAAPDTSSPADSVAASSEQEIGSTEPFAASPAPADVGGAMPGELDTLAASVPAPASSATVAPAPVVESPRQELRGEGASSPETGRYRLQLQDLRRVRLRDWPPATVRDDPERDRVWQEAQRAAEEYQSLIGSTLLSSPIAAQSACLGFAEEHGQTLQLRFLLFPVLWPASAAQAVGEAVFEIDRVSGEVHGQVRARS